MAEGKLPTSWADLLGLVFVTCLAAIVPSLVAGKYAVAVIFAVASLALGVLAIKLDLLRKITTSRGRRRRLLTWILIIAGFALLAFGVYLLAMQGSEALPNDQRGNAEQLQHERDEAVAQRTVVQSELERIKSVSSQSASQIAKLEAENRDLTSKLGSFTARVMGPMTTMRILSAIGGRAGGRQPDNTPSSNAVDYRWAVLITAPPENFELAQLIRTLIQNAGLDVQWLDAPDHSSNIDAPEMPKLTEPQVILHGQNFLNTTLAAALKHCLNIRTTSKMVGGLVEWYRDRTVPAQTIVWIEIGGGSPWTKDRRCLD